MITRRWLMDEWRDTFLTEARLHGVPGPRIGEALAEIDTHCVDSGESPEQAFGDPVDYAGAIARELAPVASRGPRLSVLRSGLLAFATVAGLLCLVDGVAELTNGDGAVTVGQVAAVVVGVAGVVVIDVFVLRPGSRAFTWRLGVAVAAGIGLAALFQALWRRPVLQPPGWMLVAVGLLLLTAAWWPAVTGRLGPASDRVVDPRTGREPFRGSRLLIAVVRWSLPVAALWLLILTVLLSG